MTTETIPLNTDGLGSTQKSVYESLVRHGSWPGGWHWDGPARTARILKSLVQRGFARDLSDAGRTRYEPVVAATIELPAKPPTPATPEHDKIRRLSAAHSSVNEFCEFLQGKGVLDESDGMIARLIAEFFDIDIKAWDAEKEALLDHARGYADWAEECDRLRSEARQAAALSAAAEAL